MPVKKLLLIAFINALNTIPTGEDTEVKTVLPCGSEVRIIIKQKKKLKLVKAG